MLLQKAPARIEVYNDIDQSVVSLFRILRDPEQAEKLRRAVELTPFGRAEYVECWEVSDDPIEEARRLIVRSFQSIGNRNRLSRNGWRTRTAKSVWSPCVSWSGWPDGIPDYVRRLKDTIIECLPWEKILDTYDSPKALFYIDPPYVLSTRAHDHRNIYANELTDADHERLLCRCLSLKGHVVMSAYEHPMYEEMLGWGCWKRLEKSSRAQMNAVRVEHLWLSPSVVTALELSE